MGRLGLLALACNQPGVADEVGVNFGAKFQWVQCAFLGLWSRKRCAVLGQSAQAATITCCEKGCKTPDR